MPRETNPDLRPFEQIREHYEIEKGLAGRLRSSGREERARLYSEVYEELYRRVPHHRKLTQKRTADEDAEVVQRQLRWLRPSVRPGDTFLEVGAGDCLVTFAVARLVKKAIAVEVSETMAASDSAPPNFQLVLSDGVAIPVPPGSVDVAYSQQLMEHLHPDDALQQLRNLLSALKPGGRYFCVTPNRVTGPHDISRHFDDVATCLHLKEYTIGELARLFREVGFRKVALYVSTGSRPREIATWPFAAIESLLLPVPRRQRIALAALVRPRVLFSFRLLGVK
jgi:SAM-dependent methyltransferase